MLRQLIRKLLHKKPKDRWYTIGNYKIWLPAEHQLDIFQKRYKNYDQHIGKIAATLQQHFPQMTILDIGANVGGTVALMRAQSTAPIVCFEAYPSVLPYLKKNLAALPNTILIESFVGLAHAPQNLSISVKDNMAFMAVNDQNLDKNAPIVPSLSQLLAQHSIDLDTVKLIKTDTEGFDFKILLDNQSLIADHRPALFFEYDLLFHPESGEEARQVVAMLTALDYGFFLFDNFGNFFNAFTTDIETHFQKANRYYQDCRQAGGGLYYYDVLAVQKSAFDWFDF